jgi:hypothetical protein
MATIIKGGSRIHAGLRAEAGHFLGTPCRYRGTASVVAKDRISMNTDDGTWREFARADVHHEQDCPSAPVRNGV